MYWWCWPSHWRESCQLYPSCFDIHSRDTWHPTVWRQSGCCTRVQSQHPPYLKLTSVDSSNSSRWLATIIPCSCFGMTALSTVHWWMLSAWSPLVSFSGVMFYVDGACSTWAVYNDAGHIRALCLKMCCKTNAAWTTLMLWTYDEHPDFCPVWLLLIYLHASGIKSGVLFPTEAELHQPPEGGTCVDPLTYKVFMAWMLFLVRSILQTSKNWVQSRPSCPTSHCVPFCNFWQWQDASHWSYASHNCINTAIQYSLYASTHVIMDLYHLDSQNGVTKWKPILLLSQAQAHVLDVNSVPFYSGMVALSTQFVEAFLKEGPTHPSYCSPALCQIALIGSSSQFGKESWKTHSTTQSTWANQDQPDDPNATSKEGCKCHGTIAVFVIILLHFPY